MSKIIKNNTSSDIFISDVGINLLANSPYIIPSQDYHLWAQSSDLITHIGSSALVINDGSYDLSKAEGIGLIQGSFIKKEVGFASNLVESNRLKVDIVQSSTNDYLSKVSANDAVGHFLDTKIQGESGKISTTVLNDGFDETLQVSIGADVFDKTINSTSDITEGTNLFFTDERAQDAAAQAFANGTSDGVSVSYNDTANSISLTNTDKGTIAVESHVMDSDPHAQYVKETDDILFTTNCIMVKKNPGTGEFLTVSDAIDSILDCSETNRYLIKVGPGIYEEPTLTLPAYCSVEGEAIQVTQIKVINDSQDLFIMNTGCELSFMSLVGLNGSGYSAVYCEDVGDFAQLHKISIYDFDIGLQLYSNTIESTLYAEYVDVNGDYSYAVKHKSNGSLSSTCQLENFYSYSSASTVKTSAITEGINSKLILHTAGFFGSADMTGVHLLNGATALLSGVFFEDFTGTCKPIFVENAGTGSILRTLATSFVNCDIHIIIEHPGASGRIFGGVDLSKCSIDNSATFSVFLLNSSNNPGITINGRIMYSSDNPSDSQDISDLIQHTPTMGLINGGDINILTGLNIELSEGYGHLSHGTHPNEVIKRIEWSTQTITAPAYAISNIYINENGTVVLNTTYPDTSKCIYIGRCLSNGSTILSIEKVPIQARHFNNSLSKAMREAFGPVFSSGSLTAETGTRQLAVTAGKYFFAELEFTPGGGSPITFTTAYKSTIPGLYNTVANQTTVSNTQYDDASGTLANIPTGKFVKHLLVLVGGPSEKYALVYGDVVYDTLLDATNGPIVDASAFSKGSFARIASVIVQQGQTLIQQIIDERPRIGFASSSSVGGVTSHSALSDLGNDDHTQYLLVSGTRAMTGDLDLNSNDIINAATVNGINVTAHASRHLPNGADPLTTGTPSSLGTSNATGIANAFSRQDHVHNHGSQSEPTHHSVATITNNGFMSATDKSKLDGIAVSANNYTNEDAQDAVGSILTDTASVDFTYNDAGNTISAAVLPAGVDHNSLANFVVNKHVDHSTVSITAGTGLSGGGDITTTRTLSLANTTVTAASYGSATQVPTYTVNAQGQLTAASNTSIQITESQVTNLTSDLAGKQPLDGDLTAIAALATTGIITRTATDTMVTRTITGTASNISVSNGDGVSGNPTINLATAGTAGTYGSATQVPVITTDAFGRVTSVTPTTITISATIPTTDTASVSLISTTSTSYVLMTGMTATPAAGTYLCLGRGVCAATSNSRYVSMSIYSGGVLGTSSEVFGYVRTGASILSNSDVLNLNTTDLITVNGSQAIELRWKTSGGTAQAQGYALTLIKVG